MPSLAEKIFLKKPLILLVKAFLLLTMGANDKTQISK